MDDELDYKHFAEINIKLKNADVATILQWAIDYFGAEQIGMTTAFGYSGLCLLHQTLKLIPDIPLYFIDTGFHFKETLSFCKEIKKLWKLNLKIVNAELNQKELQKKIGKEPYYVNADLCCHYCKVGPLLRFIHDKKVWLSGIRRDQSSTRNDIEIIEVDGRGVIKLSPMYAWTREDTWKYIKKNQIPYHPLHDKGYPSIGCQPCTEQVQDGGNERDGRWPFMQKLECGIHLFKKKE